MIIVYNLVLYDTMVGVRDKIDESHGTRAQHDPTSVAGRSRCSWTVDMKTPKLRVSLCWSIYDNQDAYIL